MDGYNIIFAWEDLKELAKDNIEAARNKLMDVLCDYQGYRRMTLILVFDAYKVPGNPGEVLHYQNIHVVYTREAETADQYIEKAVHDMSREHQVTVATSDGMEQVIIMGQGARRISARDLLSEVRQARRELREAASCAGRWSEAVPSGRHIPGCAGRTPADRRGEREARQARKG